MSPPLVPSPAFERSLHRGGSAGGPSQPSGGAGAGRAQLRSALVAFLPPGSPPPRATGLPRGRGEGESETGTVTVIWGFAPALLTFASR